MDKKHTDATNRARNKLGMFITESFKVRFWRKVLIKDRNLCWEWRGARHYKGYGEIALSKGSSKRKDKAHRVAWSLVNGDIPAGGVICHSCDNPSCCNPSHLFLGTHKTNKDDSVKKMRHAHGERSGRAKLTENDVVKIRLLDEGGMPRIRIAKQFGVSGRNITDICKRRTWIHVK